MNTLIDNLKDILVLSTSSKQTKALGRALSRYLKPGDVVCLSGELGSGKTTFVQGLANGLGIKDFIRSSSFVIVNEYKADKIKLFHIDLYRLKDKDLDGVGLEEYLYGDGICIIEWAERMNTTALKNLWQINITWQGENDREIKLKKLK